MLLNLGSRIELSCEIGTYQPNPGQAFCIPCDPGQMCPYRNMTIAVDCEEGYYCPGGDKEACPPGTFNNKTGAKNASECSDCLKGMFCLGYGNKVPDGYCIAGYYCEGGASSNAPNTSHPKYLKNGPCQTGHYCTKGTVVPTPCPRGTYRNTTGASLSTQCYRCSPGYYCEDYGLTSPTGPCLEGWYCPSWEGSMVATPKNYTCFAGHYCPNGTAYPLACKPGIKIFSCFCCIGI